LGSATPDVQHSSIPSVCLSPDFSVATILSGAIWMVEELERRGKTNPKKDNPAKRTKKKRK
jgi:hypothetical protein